MIGGDDDDESIDFDDLGPPPLRIGVVTMPTMNVSSESAMRDPGHASESELMKRIQKRKSVAIFDDKGLIEDYASVPLIELDVLPRGGISFETEAVGRIQFGIPPETIKDSMQMGIDVPRVYIVPVERFCREQGPSLGVNLAEFEFPAYFTYFVRKFKCTLVVDSPSAESEIRSVFGETLLGPAHFRDRNAPLANVDEDFDPSFPRERRPNFYKELGLFRANEKTADYDELEIDLLIDFVHYKSCRRNAPNQDNMLGVPPDLTLDKLGDDSIMISDFQAAHAEFNTKGSTSTASETSSRSNVIRRSSLFSNLSQLAQTQLIESSEHSSLQSSSGKLPRRNSDSSLSRRSAESALSVASKRMRRGSLGSLDDRRSSIRTVSSCASVNASQRSTSFRSFRMGPRRASSFTNRSSRASSKVLDTSIDSYDFIMDDEPDRRDCSWMYSQAKWLGDVATVFPVGATDEEKREKTCARVEIFKMAGGTEYIVHDVNKNNIIIGKTRFSGTVQTPDELELHGYFSNKKATDEEYFDDYEEPKPKISPSPVQSTFHPPSFGVTVLGNSHGFDKNGTTSGYVLWVNGRGIMVDPPPYSNATLEREGIRPQMIMAMIITHCHADHDAGAFQKVMRGSRVAIITTPTIYDSFIRKYSALSGLRSSLLRHSHRHRPAIIGQPLRFQGAIFHFTYTLHTIPCISFRAEWRGKSIVFTGDHMNIPDEIKRLESKGVLSKARAEDLLRLPIQKCDLLLHEAGAPPIHTPLAELQKLPQNIRDRLYVVHTAAIPPDSGLKVAPTGTAGTIRLDGMYTPSCSVLPALGKAPESGVSAATFFAERKDGRPSSSTSTTVHRAHNKRNGRVRVAPLVFLRPTDVSDAWFILNLLSAVPFLSSLSYGHTMEFLEIAHVKMYCQGEVVIESSQRSELLCVFWEGVCASKVGGTIWYAGDWTGPPPFETEQPLQAAANTEHHDHSIDDVIAISEEGVKVITLLMKDVRNILKSGSKLFRKYISMQNPEQGDIDFHMGMNANSFNREHSVLELFLCNSVLRNLNANQRITLESLAEGPRYYAINAPLWQLGDPVEFALIIVEGIATIGTTDRRRRQSFSTRNRSSNTGEVTLMSSISEKSRLNTMLHVKPDKVLQNVNRNSEYFRLHECLQQRADEFDIDEDVETVGADENRRDDGSRIHKVGSAMKGQRDKFTNKVLTRLYSRHAYIESMLFSRGCFLCDTSRMISGDLATINKTMGGGRSSSMAHGETSNDHCHTSSMFAGKQGCVAMVFPKSSLMPFLDANPGLLLSLLGTKAIV